MFNVIFKKPALKATCVSLPVILMVLTSSVQAFQTVVNQNICFLNPDFSCAQNTTQTFELTDDRLARLGTELIKPASIYVIPTKPGFDNIKSLPSVPTAILMVLFGFICISLVRDRRIWLAAIRSMLWIGQYCTETIPQLTKHLYLRTHINKYVFAKYPLLHLFKNLARPRCDIEGTSYIGLLHYLAGIPTNKTISCLYSKIAASNKFVIAKSPFYIVIATNNSTLTIKPFTPYKHTLTSNNSSRAPPELLQFLM